jgi:hypothetical protein
MIIWLVVWFIAFGFVIITKGFGMTRSKGKDQALKCQSAG